LGRSKLVQQLFVYGDAHRDFLVAIAVPHSAVVPTDAGELSSSENINPLSTLYPSSPIASLPSFLSLQKNVLQDIRESGRKAGLVGFELPCSVRICTTPFSVENEMLTPTLKLKRRTVTKTFAKAIDQMYEKGDECGEERGKERMSKL